MWLTHAERRQTSTKTPCSMDRLFQEDKGRGREYGTQGRVFERSTNGMKLLAPAVGV